MNQNILRKYFNFAFLPCLKKVPVSEWGGGGVASPFFRLPTLISFTTQGWMTPLKWANEILNYEEDPLSRSHLRVVSRMQSSALIPDVYHCLRQRKTFFFECLVSL